MCGACWIEGARRVIASDLPGHRADALKAAHDGNANFASMTSMWQMKPQCRGHLPGAFWQTAGKPNVVLNNAAITGELADGRGQVVP
jgi:3-oxoacyl-[acyl-carrier protein] reductase